MPKGNHLANERKKIQWLMKNKILWYRKVTLKTRQGRFALKLLSFTAIHDGLYSKKTFYQDIECTLLRLIPRVTREIELQEAIEEVRRRGMLHERRVHG